MNAAEAKRFSGEVKIWHENLLSAYLQLREAGDPRTIGRRAETVNDIVLEIIRAAMNTKFRALFECNSPALIGVYGADCLKLANDVADGVCEVINSIGGEGLSKTLIAHRRAAADSAAELVTRLGRLREHLSAVK